jgi:predicted 3-demethylubiquinone-9 3-methyltransferase (glyoxalase superfamily)
LPPAESASGRGPCFAGRRIRRSRTAGWESELKFNEAISLQVYCDTQEEIDYYWQKLSQGGPEQAQQCGWLKDKYGVSWQVIPKVLPDLIKDPDSPNSQRAMAAMLRMKKIDIGDLKRAYAG